MFKRNWITLLGVLSALMMLSIGVVSAQDRVEIRWFVGLGAGTDAPQIEAQEAIVREFNESQDRIRLILEIVDNEQAYGILSTQIAAGNAPDIVGPVGIRGRSNFPGAWLDLSELIEANNYDLSDFDPELVEFYNIEGEGQIGLPFAIFPSFMIYNVNLFNEAGIPYPPRNYGDPYIDWNGEEREWNLETLRDVAMVMTVDSQGNDATMEEFDINDIVQFGFAPQWTDIRGRLTLFGAGNFIDDEGTATVPQHWQEGLNWYQQAMWEDYFIPNGVYGGADFLGGGNWFESGNLAMVSIHLWYLPCCTWGLENVEYQLAPVPSYNGINTAKMHGDTFSIMETTKHPQEAFEVLTYLIGDRANQLATLYGGMPARLSLQGSYFDTINQNQPLAGRDLNWDVVAAGMAYADNPSHEGPLPNLAQAEDVYNTWAAQLDNNPDFDLEAGLPQLIDALQKIYDAAN
jgi:multiple sugar transport system substrate-binding protein